MNNVPRLPEDIQDSISNVDFFDGWIGKYVQYSRTINPLSPTSFHLSAGLSLVSTIIARRIEIAAWYAKRYPNIMVMLVSPSTINHKSRTFDIMLKILDDHFPFFKAPNSVTPEALFDSLSGGAPLNKNDLPLFEQEIVKNEKLFAAQKGFFLDECSGFFNLAKKDYNQGLIELLLKLYDCVNSYRRETKTDGRKTISNSYLTFMGATTPAMITSFIGDPVMWANGFWPRFLFAIEVSGKPDFAYGNANVDSEPIVTPLLKLHQLLPKPQDQSNFQSVQANLTPKAEDLLKSYFKFATYDSYELLDQDNGKLAAYGRLHEQALKISGLISALQWAESPNQEILINDKSMSQAISITESFRLNIHKALDLSERKNCQILEKRILNFISCTPTESASSRDIKKNFKSTDDLILEETLNTLIRQGKIESCTQSPSTGGGRPTTKYRVV